MFIPNDSVLNFVQDNDPAFLELFALDNKVVVCSPWSLYIVLSIVRQASQLYKLEKKTIQAVNYIQSFKKQWAAYKDADDKIDKKLTEVNTVRDTVTGTRSRMLEKVLNDIEKLDDIYQESPAGGNNV